MAGKRKGQHKSPIVRTAEENRQIFANRQAIIKGFTVVFSIIAVAAPLYVVYLAAKELAGKTTTISLGLTVAISGTAIAIAIKALTATRKMTKQGEELIRVRARCEVVEEQLKECQKWRNRKESKS